jgi:DNA-binding Lrp family transcriptional regulator
MESNIYNVINLKLQAHKTPVFKEEKSKDWVIYGADRDSGYYNNYPGYLLYLFNRSSKHNAFINGKVLYICGAGVGFDSKDLSIEDLAKANDFLNKENTNYDTLKDIVRKCVLDKKLFGGYYLEVIWNKAGNNFELLHFPYNNLRKAKDAEGYWYSKDWSKQKQTPEDTGLEYIPLFDQNNPTGRQIFVSKEYRPDLDAYPLPDYVASVVYAEVDVELSNYRLNAIKSGFNAGTILNFSNGRPTEEEKEEIEARLKEKFTGTDRANSLLISFSGNRDSAPTIEHLTPQNVDAQLTELNDQVIQELIIGHHIPNPMLVGIKTAGELGSKDQINDSYELYKSTYIIPNQKEIERDFNYLLKLKGFSNRIYLKELDPIEEQLPIEEKIKVMTKNEVREMYGLEPIEEEIVKPIVSSAIHRFEDQCCEHHFKSETEIDEIIELFKMFGEEREEYEVVEKQFMFGEITKEVLHEFEVNVDILESGKVIYRDIIDLLKKDPLIDNKAISEALRVREQRVADVIEQLLKDELIKVKETTVAGQKKIIRTPSKQAITVAKKEGSDVEDFKIMYTYEWRPGLKRDKRNSREFCVKLLDANKMYSRAQIEQISKIVGWDVWNYRGGWWTRKGGEARTPFCRHVWAANVVKIKK